MVQTMKCFVKFCENIDEREQLRRGGIFTVRGSWTSGLDDRVEGHQILLLKGKICVRIENISVALRFRITKKIQHGEVSIHVRRLQTADVTRPPQR